MAVALNHLIVFSRDKKRSAAFLAEVLGRPAPRRFSVFEVVDFDNGVSIDFDQAEGAVAPSHYAFLVGEAEFDEAFARIRGMGLDYWADPALQEQGRINRHDGGRGVYFRDPDGHLMELITVPYGGWPDGAP